MMLQGDCLEKLRELEGDSLDSLITDPPAGISFMGKGWDSDKGGRDHWIAWFEEVMEECYRVLKPGAHGLVWALPRTSHWTATALENAGFEIRDVVNHIFGSGFPKSLDVSKAIDKAAKVELKHTVVKRQGGGFESTGFRTSSIEPGMTEKHIPSTPEAKQWEGFGTALKPAHEHWVLIRKPLGEKTVAANVLKHGTGALNIDASRIGLNGEKNPSIARYESTPQKGNNGWEHANRGVNFDPTQAALGRFPANLVLSEDAAKELDEHTEGTRASKPSKSGDSTHKNGQHLPGLRDTIHNPYYDDLGGASRFFYVAKASKSDKGADNTHPTVKSTKLMEYLIKLITPPGGKILDPFMGSGSTGVAALRLNFQFVGIEQSPEYFAIAQKRVGA